MSSEVQICNMALSHIGGYSDIAALDNSSQESKKCKLLYSPARDSVLRDNNWNFATKVLTLALLTDTYLGWVYGYQYPVDCLMAIKIYNDYNNNINRDSIYYPECNVTDNKIEFQIISNEALTGRIILTNKEDAKLVYIAKVTDTNMFDVEFIDALSYRLASELAISLKGDMQLQQQLFQAYLMKAGQARANNCNEGYIKPANVNTFVNARY